MSALTGHEIEALNASRQDAVEDAIRNWTEVLPEDDACDWRCRQGRRVGHVCKQYQPIPQDLPLTVRNLLIAAAVVAAVVGCCVVLDRGEPSSQPIVSRVTT